MKEILFAYFLSFCGFCKYLSQYFSCYIVRILVFFLSMTDSKMCDIKFLKNTKRYK